MRVEYLLTTKKHREYLGYQNDLLSEASRAIEEQVPLNIPAAPNLDAPVTVRYEVIHSLLCNASAANLHEWALLAEREAKEIAA